MNPETVRKQDIIEDFFNHNSCFKPDLWHSDEMKVAKESIRPVNRSRNKIDFTICNNFYIKEEIKYYFGRNLK